MKKKKEIYKKDVPVGLFLISVFLMGTGMGVYKGVLDNFLAEIVGMGEIDRGLTEFFREIPGLLIVFILAALYTFSAERLNRIGSLVFTIGVALLGLVPTTKVFTILSLFILSLGEHIQMGMRSTLALQYAKEGHGGQSLGDQNAVQQIGTMLGFVLIILFFKESVGARPFRIFILVGAAFAAISTIFAFFIKGNSATDPNAKRYYFKKKFKKYYMLEVFYGARKQVFFTFGPYVLVLFYGADTRTISLLFMISAVACFFLSPLVGKLIDTVGYKPVMVADTLILVIVCFFYGFAHHLFPMRIAFIVCCVNYVLDAVISLASLATNVYVQDIADSPDEMKKTLTTGISVNHLITLFIALFGGWIWSALGMEILFILSAILGLCNSAYAASIHVPKKDC